MDFDQSFEARREYARQCSEEQIQKGNGVREYGILCFKQLFLLNAGAIGVVSAFVSTRDDFDFSPDLFLAISPWFIGAACVVAGGLFAYLNFEYHRRTLPSKLSLAVFMANPEAAWPSSAFKKENETEYEFQKRNTFKINLAQRIAVLFGLLSLTLFLYGGYRLWLFI